MNTSEALNIAILILQVLFFIVPIMFFLMMMRANTFAKKRLKKISYIPNVSWDRIYDRDYVKNRLEKIANEVKEGKTYGVILFGPPGTGKTMIAKAIANKMQWNFFELKANDILSKWYGESEYLLYSFLNDVENNSPSILFIDEIDGFAMSRSDDIHEVTHRLVNILLTKIQEMHDKNDKILIIGATNIPQEIDEAFLRPGRFDEVIYVDLPDEKERERIWKGYVGIEGIDYSLLAKKSNRFSPADIKLLSEKVISECNEKGKYPSTEDFLKYIENYKPSVSISTIIKFENIAKKYSRTKVEIENYGIPDVTWNDLGDLENVKSIIRDSIELPLKNKDFAEKLGIKPVKGILLYGPPGTGKTSIAKALSNEINASFIILSGDEIASAGPLKAPELISEKFAVAKDNSPSIIFIDEVDMLARARAFNEWRNALTQLLAEMDGIRDIGDVIVIGATNRPWDIDPALLRPGRFDKIIFVPPPDYVGRIKVLKVITRGLEIDDFTIQEVAKLTENFTPADLKLVIEEIKRNLLKEATQTKILRTKININDFKKVLQIVKPSVTQDQIKLYEDFMKRN
ncbi:AAA family ATPase [Acidianus brierleyi]|uniref:AAA family ATPase n=1 Tax=Acidianus brierleyi TaxID=41673 RepID=A0A2U9IC43_9CREN|nr:ATP-binding protein [Acidianus brierleyi]AWR93588.1 AAA family ATPase [Acidianus brierleyi]